MTRDSTLQYIFKKASLIGLILIRGKRAGDCEENKMHTNPVKDEDGEFDEWGHSNGKCPKCKKQKIRYRTWDSSCGGYTDHQYKCQLCGHTWWVDGDDG